MDLGLALAGFDDLRRRSVGAQALQQLVDAEVAQRRAEEHRRHVPFQERLRIERLAGAQDQLGVLRQLLLLVRVEV